MSLSSYFLFLDDVRTPDQAYIHPRRPEGGGIILTSKSLEAQSEIPNGSWEVVRTYEQFVAIIEARGLPLAVSFDHDIHEEHMNHYFDWTIHTGEVNYKKLKIKTGKHCAEYFLDKWRKLEDTNRRPKIFIHSANQWGAVEIKKVLQELL